ncbi:MAG: nuclear transport factor 2 family protein [Mycobacteriales bacterium]
MTIDAVTVVRRLWESFRAHDWALASEQLAPAAVVMWPQSGEAFVGRDNVIAMNRAHPAPNWRIEQIEILVASGGRVAARVVVPTDDSVDVCLGFYTVEAGVIAMAVEYWTEHRSMPTPAWREQWTTPIASLEHP